MMPNFRYLETTFKHISITVVFRLQLREKQLELLLHFLH